uniref:Putative RNA-directed DNA polymerase, eukaryota, reverse transcriptase zinc-binding domain protein n=1 Tax=Tanacetum cinerariifolium TaxID=118510 RepID=A0A6L2J4S5_TANCI|nr:putative RNA-directed DNA polymerase, eukaryota, reverse transcriptase zinc-binding domain protein [Tanacetum cinerariifolium]
MKEGSVGLCLDRHLLDHRPILLHERSFSHSDRNGMIRFKKKLQGLKISIRNWIKDKRLQLNSSKKSIHDELIVIDKELDCGLVVDTRLARRQVLKRQLQDIISKEAVDVFQKSKVKWAIEGDENSCFFHGIINKRRSQSAIRGIFVNGAWQTDPHTVKEAFLNHFAVRFKKPTVVGPKINFIFPKRLAHDQATDLESNISRNEIRTAVWNCGDNKSPGTDGFTFEFFKKYWGLIGPYFCEAVEYFFVNGAFPIGCNSSFIALIPKVVDAKHVNDFRPIRLIGGIYKVVTKIMANRLATVISDIVSNTQSAFVSGRQILNGPFIINEILDWCKRKCKKVMFSKVDFAKAYDSVRWDYLIDVLMAFGFGSKWCQWIQGTFCFAKASILVNGSPINEFQFHRGLKQGDPLALLLFILVMESLHLSFSRVVEAGVFKGIRLNSSIPVSYLFYAVDTLILGEWSSDNLRGIINVLNCFYLASGLQINIQKSQLLGVGVYISDVRLAASSIGCSIMKSQFRYLGVMVGANMARHKAWADVILKLRSRLSKWKTQTLSVGGRLTLLKSVLGVSTLYYMSIFKAPKGVLKEMESIRNNFFIGADPSDKKITWVAWNKVLASKEKGGLANKLAMQMDSSFRRTVRGGIELSQFNDLVSLIGSISLSSSSDRWVCNASGDGIFRVKDIRNFIDDLFLPSSPEPTRWVKSIPIKINVFMWRARRDCLSTRANLMCRGVVMESANCPICGFREEDAHHIFFQYLVPTLKVFWNAFSVWHGGQFGLFEIVFFMTTNLLHDRRLLMILWRYLFFGVKIDVNGRSLGRIG